MVLVESPESAEKTIAAGGHWEKASRSGWNTGCDARDGREVWLRDEAVFVRDRGDGKAADARPAD